MATKSILRYGYMAVVLAELKRDAGKLWVEPESSGLSQVFYRHDGFRLIIDLCARETAYIRMDDGYGAYYTPARFRAALRRIKQKGGK